MSPEELAEGSAWVDAIDDVEKLRQLLKDKCAALVDVLEQRNGESGTVKQRLDEYRKLLHDERQTVSGLRYQLECEQARSDRLRTRLIREAELRERYCAALADALGVPLPAKRMWRALIGMARALRERS